MTVQKYDGVRVVTLRIKGADTKFVEMPPKRWAAFRQLVDDVNTSVKAVANGDVGIKLRLHMGGAYYISVTSGIRCVDFRKFYKPYGATEDEIKPTKHGVALRLDEWAHLCTLIDAVNASYPKLAEAQPCYYDDDHMNQMGWIACTECHPFGEDIAKSASAE